MLNNIGLQQTKKLQGKQKVFKEGEKASTMYLVKGGEVLCLKLYKDRLIPIFHAKEGDIIGESAMIAGSTYTYSAITLGYTELTEMSSAQFKQIFTQSPPWLVDLTKTMIQRFENTANLVAENRLIHPSITKEEDFTSSVEIEYKKIIG